MMYVMVMAAEPPINERNRMTAPHNDPNDSENFITTNAQPAPPQSDATPVDVTVSDTSQLQPPPANQPGDDIPVVEDEDAEDPDF